MILLFLLSFDTKTMYFILYFIIYNYKCMHFGRRSTMISGFTCFNESGMNQADSSLQGFFFFYFHKQNLSIFSLFYYFFYLFIYF